MDNTDMYWDDICWNDVVPDWDENGELKPTFHLSERRI